MSDLPIIAAQITVANVKDINYNRKDGTPAVFKSIGVKNPDGTWLNLSDFDDVRHGLYNQGAVLDVGYTEKYATMPNGAPKLYNGVQTVYRTIESAFIADGATGDTQTAAPAPAGSSGGSVGAKPSFDAGLSARQTACNDAIQAANAEATIGKLFDLTRWLDTFDAVYQHIHNTLTGVDELDAAITVAKEKLGATEVPVDDTDIPFD